MYEACTRTGLFLDFSALSNGYARILVTFKVENAFCALIHLNTLSYGIFRLVVDQPPIPRSFTVRKNELTTKLITREARGTAWPAYYEFIYLLIRRRAAAFNPSKRAVPSYGY